MEKPARNVEIDLLRGIAIFFMIVIHTSYYFISNKLMWFMWNYSHFAVQTFVFCSAFVFFLKWQTRPEPFLQYLKKRFVRLYVPYLLFLLIFIPLTTNLSHSPFTPSYVIQSLLMNNGGVDIGWLVLLFLAFAALFPILYFLWEKMRPAFFLYMIVSVASSLYFMFHSFSGNYRMIFWLPWSFLIGFTWFFIAIKNKRVWFFISAGTSVFLFVSLFVLQSHLGHAISLINNKYPPNLFYLSYGMVGLFVLFSIASSGLLSVFRLIRPISFLSKYSYSLYFIHYTILIITVPLIKKFGLIWFEYFMFVFFVSILGQFALNLLQAKFDFVSFLRHAK